MRERGQPTEPSTLRQDRDLAKRRILKKVRKVRSERLKEANHWLDSVREKMARTHDVEKKGQHKRI